jgi:hypothetical protein
MDWRTKEGCGPRPSTFPQKDEAKSLRNGFGGTFSYEKTLQNPMNYHENRWISTDFGYFGLGTMMVEDKCFSKNNKEASKSELLNS